MSAQLQKTICIDFYKKNLGKVNTSNTDTEDLYIYYKGWLECIMQKANTILDRMSMKDKAYYLKTDRLPKEYHNTPFGSAYEKLENLVGKMLSFEYSKNSHEDCMRFYNACDKYVDDVIAWLKENEPKSEQLNAG